MIKHHYECETCKHTFDTGKIIKRDGSEYECCPLCESWNYNITNLYVRELDGMHFVEYSSPSIGMTIFGSGDSTEVQRVINRMMSLRWDVFQSVIAAQNPDQEARLYLDNKPCLMNSFTPLSNTSN